ncbi:hypothetical protein AB7849_15615 [Rhodanobacter sp. 115]|uniref:hypothetical protein n=1 Tax=Rhodanobacter sp. FW021-MT20 TaxID=1162282 RepID=UPI0034E3EE9D
MAAVMARPGNARFQETPALLVEAVPSGGISENTAMELCISICLTVHDESAFREAARDRALEDGLGDETANAYLDEEQHSLGQCAIMLLDPGVSPNGCQIIDSTAD